MYKLSHLAGGRWVEHSHPAVFERETTSSGAERLKIGVPAGDQSVLRTLASQLNPPLLLLYVLHTPRGEGQAGRYQSRTLELFEFAAIMDRYGAFLAGDGRHDLWVHSPADGATLIWDRHNLLFAYGLLEGFEAALRGLGFEARPLPSLHEHQHHYRQAFDADASALLAALDWEFSPLRPEDEQ